MGKKKVFRIIPPAPVKLDVVQPSNHNNGQKPAQGSVSSTSVTGPSHGGLPKKEASLEALNEGDVESALEKLMNKVVDEASLSAFAQLWNKEMKQRTEMLEANRNPSYEEFEKLIGMKKLDSNLKKCSGFVRKLKQYSDNQKSSIEGDLKTLNLSKYLTEIATAVTEARFKIDQVHDAMAICSWIHQRYADFSAMVVENYKTHLPIKKFDMSSSSLSKLSVDMRIVGELVMVGIIPVAVGCSIIGSVIRNLVASDKEGLQCLIPLLSFVMGMGDAFLGVIPRKISDLCKKHNVILVRNDTVPKDAKRTMKSVFDDYFSFLSQALIKLHQEKQKSELYNRKLLKTKGEIPQERKESHVALEAKFDKYKSVVAKFADIIDEDLPILPELPADPDYEEEKMFTRGGAEDSEAVDTVPGIVIFEDEETRSFYQDFKDLKVYLPPVAYRESVQQAAQETQEIEEREKALNDFDDMVETAELEQGSSSPEEELPGSSGDADLPPSLRQANDEKENEPQMKQTFKDYLDNLLFCCNRAAIDKAALEFAESHNSKPNRKKLVQDLFRVPRQRIDLLPFYARLVAILNPVMPDVGLELCRLLRNDMIFLVRKRHQIFIETKLKIIRFIGELVNFRIFPKSDALFCLKILLMNFVHHQIEMACVLVETCGRILYRTPDSQRRMKIYMEEMVRKKTVKNLEPRYLSMIDHAMSIVIPRENAPKVLKKFTPIELYLRPILLDDLNKTTYKITLSILKTLDWADDWVSEVACRCFTRPWLITHQQLQLQAELLKDLIKTEPGVVTRVVDIVLEEIRRGLEHPGVHYNHRRYCTLTYLSELYYYRLLRTDTLFDVLYLLITFGVSWDPSRIASMDPPDNVMRIRLTTFLLKDCGEYLLGSGSNRKRLRLFMLHLQKYIWLKRSLPVWQMRNFPFGVLETFEEAAKKLHPKMKIAKSYEEATEALSEMEEDGDASTGKPGEKMPKLLPVSETAELFPFLDPWQKCLDLQESQYGKNGQQVSRRGSRALGNDIIFEEDEDEDPYERGSRHNISPEDHEFNALFEKMCSEVNYSGRQMKTDISIPLHVSNSTHSTSAAESASEDSLRGPSDTVAFKLMTRKGNKQQFKTLALPADSDLVRRIRSREELERAEKESVKKRTLAISQLQDDEELQQELAAINMAFNAAPYHQRRKV